MVNDGIHTNIISSATQTPKIFANIPHPPVEHFFLCNEFRELFTASSELLSITTVVFTGCTLFGNTLQTRIYRL